MVPWSGLSSIFFLKQPNLKHHKVSAASLMHIFCQDSFTIFHFLWWRSLTAGQIDEYGGRFIIGEISLGKANIPRHPHDPLLLSFKYNWPAKLSLKLEHLPTWARKERAEIHDYAKYGGNFFGEEIWNMWLRHLRWQIFPEKSETRNYGCLRYFLAK